MCFLSMGSIQIQLAFDVTQDVPEPEFADVQDREIQEELLQEASYRS